MHTKKKHISMDHIVKIHSSHFDCSNALNCYGYTTDFKSCNDNTSVLNKFHDTVVVIRIRRSSSMKVEPTPNTRMYPYHYKSDKNTHKNNVGAGSVLLERATL